MHDFTSNIHAHLLSSSVVFEFNICLQHLILSLPKLDLLGHRLLVGLDSKQFCLAAEGRVEREEEGVSAPRPCSCSFKFDQSATLPTRLLQLQLGIMQNPLQLCRAQQAMQADKSPETLNHLEKRTLAKPSKLVPYTSSQSDSLTYI